MGMLDAKSKKYMKNREHFAAAFNFLMYDGKPVIDPEKLTPVDSVEGAIIDENGVAVPIQKFRDSLEAWGIMEDDHLVYVLLGGEFQSEVHYAGPVKDMVYDSVNYVDQVNEFKRKYRKKDEEAELSFEEDGVKIRLTRAEFLSGLRKGDKLKPVVTLMIYLGTGPWDGPRCLHDMLHFPDERIKDYVPDYKLNLIVPIELKEEDFPKFGPDLGFLMRVLNHGEAGVAEMLSEPQYHSVDGESALLANDIAKLGLDIVIDEGGKADMCKAMKEHDKKTKVIESVETARAFAKDDQEVIRFVTVKHAVTPEYVINIMKNVPQTGTVART